MRRLVALAIFGALWIVPASAVNPDEMLKDPALELRARDISAGLRCLVCQNQSIDDSNSGLARDLRLLVREQLSQGKSDDEVVQYLRERFGNYITLKPPFQANTLLLWLAPALAFAVSVGAYLMFMRRGRDVGEVPSDLSEDELAQLHELERD